MNTVKNQWDSMLLILLLLLPVSQMNAHKNNLKPEEVKTMNQIELKAKSALRIGVIGLVHTHVHWILGREQLGDIEIVGIVEPNRALAEAYAKRHGYSMEIVFNTMEEMISKTQPEAVTAFNTIYGHLEVVEYCAPKGSMHKK